MVPCFPGTEATTFGQGGTGGDNSFGSGVTSLNCPYCEVNNACPHWGTGENTSEGGTVNNVKFDCEVALADVADDATTAAWQGDGSWFIGRDCSAPDTFIMPLKTPYGYFLWQTTDNDSDGTPGLGAKTACWEDMYCQGDGLTSTTNNGSLTPIVCPNGYKCTTLTTHEHPNLKPSGGIF
jgi:hypothetical protein